MLVFDQVAQERLKEDGVWREYRDGVRVKIRPVTPNDTRNFQKKSRKSGRFDEAQHDLLFWDHLVIDWEGIVGPDKQKLPLTAANKVAVFRSMPALNNWACNESDRLTEEVAMAEEAELGNSEGSPAGRRTGRVTEASSSPAPAAG